MADNKGFTMLELMLAAVVTVILLGLVMPFFIAQSTFSYNSSQNRTTAQSVDLSLLLLKRDILQSAFGVRLQHPELGIYVDNSNPDKLYINFSGYLNIRGDLETLPTSTSEQQSYRSNIRANSVFRDGKTDYQGHTQITSLPFKLVGVPSDVTKGNIGAVIFSGGAMEVDVRNTTITPESLQGFQTMTFSGLTGLSGVRVAPAICYKVVNNALWRNAGSTSSPWGHPLLGVDPTQGDAQLFEVSDFQVRCQFVDIAGNVSWSPDSCVFGMGTCSPANLKQIEITITYRAKMRSGGWSAGTVWGASRKRTMTTCPRALAVTN
ncbi:MAG: hypothetical protein AB1646_03235 [Thermodesulfobacteriota bacterium]